MNILLTSVGRRAYMVKYFKEVIGSKGTIHVCNSDEKSIAFKYADKHFVSPLIYDEDYISYLINYCEKNTIDIVVSLFDIDLLVLARNKKKFEEIGTKVIVSDVGVIEMCNDKWSTYNFLLQNGFFTPKTFLKVEDVISNISVGNISYPIIVKPRYGCGSISVSKAYDEEELYYLTRKTSREIAESYLKYESAFSENIIIYQECLFGQECGADIINDLDGKNRNVIVRKKIAMRSGETDIAEIIEEPIIFECLTRLGKITKHIANMDCDLFWVDNKPYIIELNARFGGGYPFSHMAGCNLPRAIIDWTNGKSVQDSMLLAKANTIGYKELSITIK